MKKYPKIKRLSTLGIIHHQSFDYEFNTFRTDFVGEGGSGKSMIADMLQLIFVGPSAFHSPTKSTGPRKPKTMVLKSKNTGTDSSYAFINVEVEKGKFIVIGIYLESTGTSHMFIIQEGTDFDEEASLIPFSSLLSYSDFLKDDNILPIEYLKDHISDSLNLTCESWQKTTHYHKLLCSDKNTIIPVDISKNYKALENYSKIIQAFSRESLDITKSDRIQSFLFGNDKEKKFYDAFIKAVDELSGDVKLFESNSIEIKKLEDKQLQLQELLQRKQERDNNKEQLFHIEHNYQKFLNSNSKRELIKAFEIYDRSIESLIFLEKNATQKLLETSSAIKGILEEYNTVYKAKVEWETKNNKLKTFKGWLKEFDCSKDEIILKHQNYHKSKDTIEKINSLNKTLKVENILPFFETKDVWPTKILVEIEVQLNQLKESQIVKEKLKALHNINDSKSLAYWALNLKRKLSLDEESIIHKYQNEGIRIEEPNKIEKRYIPEPNLLIDNINITKKTDIGFWLNLNGISEFVQYVAEPIFNNDTESIRQYFTNQDSTLSADIDKLNKEINNYEVLKRVFEKTKNLEEHIIAWNSRNTIEELQPHILFDASEDDIKEYSNLFSSNKEIDTSYSEAVKNFDKIDAKRSSLITLEDNLYKELEAFKAPNFDTEIDPYKKDNDYIKNEDNTIDNLLTQLNNTEDYYREFIKLKDIELKKSNQLETIQKLNDIIIKSDKRTTDLKDEFEVFFNKEFKRSIKVQIVDEKELEDLKKENEGFENRYLFKYNSLVREFLESKKERYEDTGDFVGLCKEILPPEIFDENDLLNENLVSNINKRLREINEKNRRLNGRKLQKLSAIIDEVNTEVSEQLEYFRNIKNFLNTEDKTITGGHRANLSRTFNDAFPREWMSKFTEQIENDLGLSIDQSLLDPLKGLTNELEKFTSLQDKMIEAFYRCGGSKNIKPTIEDLLNPKSYYDLKFTIKSIHTKNSNDGSTSQTYAAIALLCIARLSLIEKKFI